MHALSPDRPPRSPQAGRRSAAAVLAALLLGSGCAEPDPSPHFLLVTVDTLRADHLTPYGHERDTTPFLAELAADAVLFEDALAQCGTTPHSLSSLMTSLYPVSDGVVDMRGQFVYLRPQHVTLARRLSDAGYRTHAITASIQSSTATGVELGFETFDGIDMTPGERVGRRDAAEITRLAEEWLRARDDDRPFFLWLHYLDPHHPYRAPDEYAPLFASQSPEEEGETRLYRFDEKRSDAYPLSDGELARLVLDYDREVRYTDDALRELFEGALAPILDETLVVITADHGEALGHKGIVTHNDLYQSIVHVPLILRPPGGSGGAVRVEDPVMLVDVVPTALDYLGLAPPPGVRGESLRPLVERRAGLDPERLRIAEYDYQAVYRGPMKVIAGRGAPELYDLAADPAEAVDLAGERADLRRELARAGRNLRRSAAPGGADEPRPEVTPEMVEELRALGYTDD